MSNWLAGWRAEGWDAPHVIVNVGAIDSGFCRTDLACARNSIQHVIDAVGPGHHIWWPQITRLYTRQDEADTWNTALAEFDAARDDFTTWDWPSVLVADGYRAYDGTHLASPADHERRSERIAHEVHAVWATAHRVGDDAPLPSAIAAPSRLTPLDPVRVLDTRQSGIVGAGQSAEVALATRVPTTATSVVINVTATQAGADGFLTTYPCGAPVPEASNVNFVAGQDRAASAVVPVGAGAVRVRVLVSRRPCRRRSGGVPGARRFTRALARRPDPARRRRRRGRSDPADPGRGSCRRGRGRPDRGRRRDVGIPHGVPVRRRGTRGVVAQLRTVRGRRRIGVRGNGGWRDLRLHVRQRPCDRRPARPFRVRWCLVRRRRSDSHPRHAQWDRWLAAHPRCGTRARRRGGSAGRGCDHGIIDRRRVGLDRMGDGPPVWIRRPQRVERQLGTEPRRGERHHGPRR